MTREQRNVYLVLALALPAVSLLSLAVGTTGVTIVGHWDSLTILGIYQQQILPRLVMGMLTEVCAPMQSPQMPSPWMHSPWAVHGQSMD